MPNAGLLDLVAHGVQDVYLIGNPQITFFKTVYKRHTNFAIESIQAPITGDTDFGKKITVNIPRKADLLHTMIMEVDLPTLSTTASVSGAPSTATGTVTYVDNIGHALIDYAEIRIGGNIIDRQYGEWMEIWTQLSQSESKKNALDIMLDRTGNLSTTGDKTVYIPFQFWFCRNIGLALPLVALQYHEVELEVNIRPLSELTTTGPNPYYHATGVAGTNTITLSKIDSDNTPSIDSLIRGRILVLSDESTYTISFSGTDNTSFSSSPYTVTLTSNLLKSYNDDVSYIKPNGTLSTTSTPTISQARIFLDYIYLDTYEKKEFSIAKHRYLIEQLQFNGEETLEANTNNQVIKINFNLPVKELYWVFQLHQTEITNDLFNYSNTVASGIVKGNILKQGTVMINGLERFQERKADYFRLIQPYQKHTRVPENFFCYVYSFGLNPEDFQPSGCSNFSKIDNVNLKISLNDNVNINNIRIYGLNYNILRIFNGMGGVAFTN